MKENSNDGILKSKFYSRIKKLYEIWVGRDYSFPSKLYVPDKSVLIPTEDFSVHI